MTNSPGWQTIGTGRTIHFGCAKIQLRYERRADGSRERVVLEVDDSAITVIEPGGRMATDQRALITKDIER